MTNYRICPDCKKAYFYSDSPPADRCFCGRALREVTEAEYIEIINRNIDVNFPTHSC